MDARTRASEIDRAEIVEMADEVVRMLGYVRDAFTHLDAAPLVPAAQIGRQVQRQERGLIDRLTRRTLPPPAGAVEDAKVFVPMHLERIAHDIEELSSTTERILREGTLFTDRAMREVKELFDTALELLEGLRDALRTGNRTLVRYVLDAGRSCETRASEYALFHEQRLVEGVCQPRASSAYLAMLDHLQGVEWHARQVAERLEVAGLPGERDSGYLRA